MRLVSTIGKGSAATVHRGELVGRNGIRRRVAAKVVSAVSSEEADFVFSHLMTTARRNACVDHPNVVQVYDVVDHRGQPCVLTELVDGVTLADLQARFASTGRRMPLDLALFIAGEVAEGLAGARVARGPDGLQIGMLHQSLTPREVLLSWRGEVKVADFEMSKARACSSSVRSLRALAQRSAAMAPEVAQGHEPDARSDVFAFGVLFHELLIGPRFPAGLNNSELMKLAREGYVQPQTFRPNLPEVALSVLKRALEVDPELRYPNAVALAYDMRRVLLAMGVGDGRYFLRRTLEHEWADRGEEATSEVSLPMTVDSSEYQLFDGEVIELDPRSTKRRK
ncbi:MAG: serine/threonine protein kinase [Labilithrix sp.]|nr:serine/threonine protein kinase [Labilithrix sp.]